MNDFGIPFDGKIILSIGSLVERKGHLDMIAAFSLVRKEIRNAHLVICGQGPLKERMEELIGRLGITHCVTIIDGLSYDKMPNLHSIADVFCLPSYLDRTWQEQFGYVFIEAMACGVPVISTNTGSISEVVSSRCGILVAPGDSLQLSKALIKLLTDDFLRTSKSNESIGYAKQFDNKIISQKILEVYNNVLGK